MLQELRTVFLINCGAGAFIKDFAPTSAHNVRFVVVDSHRPVHPKYNDQQDTDCFLFLAPDDPQQLQDIPVRHEFDDVTEAGKPTKDRENYSSSFISFQCMLAAQQSLHLPCRPPSQHPCDIAVIVTLHELTTHIRHQAGCMVCLPVMRLQSARFLNKKLSVRGRKRRSLIVTAQAQQSAGN